jgi:hypothetical protein
MAKRNIFENGAGQPIDRTACRANQQPLVDNRFLASAERLTGRTASQTCVDPKPSGPENRYRALSLNRKLNQMHSAAKANTFASATLG